MATKKALPPRFADCTHCGKRIFYDRTHGTWYHCTPEPGLKPFACRPVQIATPKRGTESTSEASR